MKNIESKDISGSLFIITAVFLTSNEIYTSIKDFIVDASGSIGLAIIVAWGLIVICLVSGIYLLKQS